MAQKTNSYERFWKELKRRKVVHVITVYAAVSFVILQLVDIVEQPLRLPDWTTAFIIVLLCIGFIIAVFVSWIYDITPAGVKKTKPARAVRQIDQTAKPASSGWKIATYSSGAIIIALIAFNFISKRNLNTNLSKLEKSIAVLPFINDSPDTTNTYFINGLMDKITTNLQMVKELRVVSRTSVEQYRNRTKSIPEIAKELDVNYIVEGNGQKYGSSFSVDVKLIKAKGKETHLWAKPYEQEIKEVKDYIKVQSQIAQAIASELKAVITPEEKKRIEKVPTTNLTALAFYQRGREEEGKFPYYALTSFSTFLSFYNIPTKDKQSLEILEIAEKMYKTALKYDSSFAMAYSGLAGIYWDKNYYKEYFSKNFLDSVLILAKKALLFDDQLPDAYYIQGMYFSEKGSNKQALEEFDKALKYNPNYWLAYFGKGFVHFYENDHVMALENFQKAASLYRGSGLSDILRIICFTLFDSGFGDLAKTFNLEAVKLEPDSIKYFFWSYLLESNTLKGLEFLKKGYSIDSTNNQILQGLAGCYSDIGYFKESIQFYKRYLDRLKEQEIIIVNMMGNIGYVYWKAGLKDSADYYFNKQIELCNDAINLGRPYGNYYAYYDLAGIYAFMGDKIKAIENLKSYNKIPRGEGYMTSWIKNDPLLNSIRDEPEFQQIVRDVEARYQAEHERVKKWIEEQGML